MANVKSIYGLTPMQEGMLYHSMLNKDDTSYHCQNLVWLNSDINIESVKETMGLLSDKYEVLKTSFIIPKSSGKPWQVVLESRDINVNQIIAFGKNEAQISEQIVKEDLNRGFDLKDDSLIRLTIASFGKERHLFMFSFHHIIMDGWCISLILKDFLKIYKDIANGTQIDFIKNGIISEKSKSAEYKEYIDWINSQDKEECISYWMNLLEDYNGNAEIIPMSTLEAQDNQVEVIKQRITDDLYAEIEKFSINNDVTVNTMAEAAWGLLLSKYTYSQDVVFGKVVSGRNAPIRGVEQIVGLFVNTTPIRAKYGDRETIVEYIKNISEQGIKANQYSYCALVDIQEKLNGRSSLIQNLFVFENYYVDESAYEEGIKEFNLQLDSAREKTNFNLGIAFFNSNNGLDIALSYNPNVYSEKEMKLVVDRLLRIFKSFTKSPDSLVKDISLIEEEEKNKILLDFNDTDYMYKTSKSIIMMLEEQVKKTPDNIAVQFNDQILTYRQFNNRVNGLSHKLKSMGIGVGDFVVIIAERSIEMVEGIYAILKAGAACVPIDVSYPPRRIEYIVNNCSPKLILTYGAEIETDIQVIDIESGYAWVEMEVNPEHVNSPEDTVYCIYTSGTSGEPKGVLNKHGSLCNLMNWINEKYPLEEGDAILFKTAYVFDVSVSEIFWWSFTGAKLVILPPGDEKVPDKIAQSINDNNISIVNFVPSMLSAFLIDKNIGKYLSPLKYMIVGGEALNLELVNRFYDIAEAYKLETVLINGYGPTESMIYTTLFNCKPDTRKVLIGRPVGNVKLYVAKGDELCGIGVPGELYIGGKGLAKGYLNMPELTREKFVDNPFARGKVYKSGDLVRWMADGNIEYLNRIDDQVKVRGFRIELGEIENIIRRIEKINDVAVIVIKDASGENIISAYIVSDDKDAVDEVKEVLNSNLPSYMIPSYITIIPHIPLTVNGKLDRRALAQFEIKRKTEYVEAETEIQRVVCNIFESLLKVDKVGIYDNFFELGGHSLKAIALVNRIEAELSCKIPIGELFNNNTPKAIETYIINEKKEEHIHLPKAEKKNYYVASSMQKRMYLLNSLSGDTTFYNMPACIRIYGEISKDRMEYILRIIMKRHAILRTDFQIINGEIMQHINDELEAEFRYLEDRDSYEEDLIHSFVRSFSLDKAPLIRMCIVKRAGHSLLMIDMHHIIGDGISMELLIAEFMSLYNNMELSPVEYQYYDYCEWMNNYDYTAQKEYWTSQFSDEVPVLHLPYDFVRPKEQSFRGKTIIHKIDKELSKSIYKLNKRLGTTEYMFFLATAMILLSKYSRQEDIVIGSPVSGRVHKDFENIPGMFVNTLALRGKAKKENSFETFIKEIKSICLKAYENQIYPFEDLVENVDCPRDISRNPLFDVMLAYQNTDSAKINFAGNSVEKVEFENMISKFDLTFNIYPEEDSFRMELEYCADLFREESIINLLENYEAILSQVLNDETMKISDIEAISENGYKRIVHGFNDTTKEYDEDITIVEKFESIVKQYGSCTALKLDNMSMSYEELNKRANALGVQLRKRGVGVNDFVALITNRSFEMIIAMLAVVKAGAAYVPVDPSYPKDRIDYMLEDCKAKIALKYEAEIDTNIPVIDLSDPSLWNENTDNLPIITDKNSAVYCIYTSGTTGRPKGVVVENRGLLCYAINNINHCDITKEDNVLQFANYVFDASAFELYIAILSGASLVLTSSDTISNIKAFDEYTKEHNISIAILPPSYYLQSKIRGLKVLFTGGSTSNKAVLERAPRENYRYINAYGPTENSIVVSMWDYDSKYDNSYRIPIGRPIMNSRVYMMDGNNMCGIGVPGELCVVGHGVARGYLNQDKMTKEKFVESPFGDGRMYKTGDLARWLDDGNIEFLGRIDDQVKVRGFRIELAEIEENIRNINGISDVAVICKADNNEENAIYAYFVSREEIDLEQFRRELANILPSHMIPSYMMQIDEIPLNQSGKVNVKLLPDIHDMKEREYIQPQTELEKIVCSIFEQVLVQDRIGITDNFFEYGGHSLNAMLVINHIEEKTGIRLSLKDLFRNNTVQKICKCLRKYNKTGINFLPQSEKREYYQMSPSQRRTYMMCQIEDVGTSYNITQCLKSYSPLDVDRVKYTLKTLIARHEILRTTFTMENGGLVQKIYDDVEPDFDYMEDETREETKLIKSLIKPFDFLKAPLMRIRLIKRKSEYLLFLDMHHIIGDGMSIEIFTKEFFEIYSGHQLPELNRQYRDYSEWLATVNLDSQKEYWLNTFSEDIPVLELPYDFVRPVQQSYEGNTIYEKIDRQLTKKIKKFASTYEATDFMVLLSSLMILLHKYSTQEDIVVGTVSNGRLHRDTENMLGMFINTLALRGKPEKSKKIASFIEEIKSICLEAFENQGYPFEELVNDAKIEVDRSRKPLFDVMMILQNNASNDESIFNNQVEYLKMPSSMSKFDFTLYINEYNGEYELAMEYCTKLFKQESIENMLKHFIQVLEQLTENAHMMIENVETITSEEKDIINNLFNDTEEIVPSTNIIKLFKDQLTSNSERLAFKFEDKSITYKELDELSSVIAHKLKNLKIGLDDRVVIIAERSLELIIGIYGILKAGAAYVPIDPDYPEDRSQYMIEDSSAKAVLVYNVKFVTELPLIDLADKSCWEAGRESVDVDISPDNLAYVMYTSGTTGRPKGVMLEHHNIVNYCYNVSHNILKTAIDEGLDKFVCVTNSTFDIFVTEIFLSILNGMTVTVANRDEQERAADFKALINNNHIEIVQLTPSRAKMLMMDDSTNDVFRNVNHIMLGGEKVENSLVKKLRTMTDARLQNVYGPTETSVWSTQDIISEEDLSSISIGKPITNTKVYIMDGNKMCGIGVPGELCISGKGVARGYLNMTELTEEKFIQNPFDEGRLYRTGDLARWLHDGRIEYISRIDQQVKVRGHRIELGEIENEIRKISDITNCAVIVKSDRDGENAIFAYIVSNTQIDINEIRKILLKKLPDYMVPAYMAQIEEIPLNKSAKLDRKQLPDICETMEREYIEPENKIQKIICSIYEEILNVEKVGISDGFFELGGNSLRAIMVINHLESSFGIRLSLKDIFDKTSPEKIAILIEERIKHTGKSYYQAIPKAEKKEYYPMTHIQRRFFMLKQIDPDNVTYNMPMCVKLKGILDERALKDSFVKLIQRHEILRTKFMINKDNFVQHVLDSIESDLDIITDYKSSVKELMEGFVRPFDLEKAPLMRMRLVKQKESNLLLFDMHHIISDGTSMELMIAEFIQLYKGIDVPEPRLQYSDYSEWIKDRSIESQKEYWISQFTDEIPILNMPYDFPRSRRQLYNGSSVLMDIPEDLWCKIKDTAAKNNLTDNILFLGALMITLGKYSKQEDIVIGTPVSGRVYSDTENMLGSFVNTLALRGKPISNNSVIEFFEQLKDTCLKGYDNQEYPYEELVEAVDVQRDISRNPIFDVMLTFQNIEENKETIDGIQVEQMPFETNISKFDLSFYVREKETTYECLLEYCTDLFRKESAEGIQKHFMRVLASITDNMKQKIGDIDLLTEEERHQILNEFNKTYMDFPEDKTIIDVLEQQAEKNPNAIALEYGDKTLSYSEFNKKVNVLARRIQGLGARKNDRVAIIAKRSFEMVEAIYSILKSGCTYVPIDPEYPDERLKFILKDCNAKTVLIYGIEQSNDLNLEIPIINLADEEIWIGNDENLTIKPEINDGIYCIYTSGTTGNPKGVINTHRGLSNLIFWMQNKYTLTSEDAILLKTTYVFDISASELLWWVFAGCKLVILEPDAQKDAYKICDAIEKYRISMIDFVPSMLSVFLMEEKFFSKLRSLKYIIVAGEALNPAIVNRYYELAKKYMLSGRLANLYGPTETSIYVSWYDCVANCKTVPIGKPIGNTEIYIMENDRLCGIGIPGELFISGRGLAKGYLNRDDLNKEKFIDNPFASEKMYRTGDLARWTRDGNIEYLGRIDDQVKIRGFRIELSEIDSKIKKIEGVRDSAVVIREHKDGHAIYAYIVSEERDICRKVKEELVKDLPNYMIPSYMATIDEIPLTINGKLNKKKLPDIIEQDSSRYVEAETEQEKIVCKYIQEIIGRDKVSVMDSFFAIGGDSIKAMQLVIKIEQSGMHLSLSDIFDSDSIRSLCHRLIIKADIGDGEEESGTKVSSLEQFTQYLNDIWEINEKSIIDRNIQDSYSLSAMQQLTSSKELNMGGIIVDFNSRVNVNILKESLFNIINSQGTMRSSIIKQKKEIQLVEYDEIKDLELAFVDLSSASEKLIEDVRSHISNKIFNERMNSIDEVLNRVLYRFFLVKYADNKFKLYMVFSHLIFDGMSMDILKSTIVRTYLNRGKLVEQDVPKFNYGDYIRQIEKGTIGIDENELINKFELKKFARLLKEYDNAPKNELSNFRLSFKLDKNANEYSHEKMWNASYEIFKKILGHTFNMTEIPFAMMISGREYYDKQFYSTVGEFIDLMPMSDKVDRGYDFKYISQLIRYVGKHNINFISLMLNERLRMKYMRILIMLRKLINLMDKLPVFSYLGMFTSNLNKLEEIETNMADQVLSMTLNVYYNENTLHIESFGRENDKDNLIQIVHEYLVKEGMIDNE